MSRLTCEAVFINVPTSGMGRKILFRVKSKAFCPPVILDVDKNGKDQLTPWVIFASPVKLTIFTPELT